MNKELIKKDFKEKFSELRKIMNAWDLICDAPKDEFDGLNHQILSHLYRDADFEKINRVLESELSVNYGLYISEISSEEKATEIMEWWNSKDKIFY